MSTYYLHLESFNLKTRFHLFKNESCSSRFLSQYSKALWILHAKNSRVNWLRTGNHAQEGKMNSHPHRSVSQWATDILTAESESKQINASDIPSSGVCWRLKKR